MIVLNMSVAAAVEHRGQSGSMMRCSRPWLVRLCSILGRFGWLQCTVRMIVSGWSFLGLSIRFIPPVRPEARISSGEFLLA